MPSEWTYYKIHDHVWDELIYIRERTDRFNIVEFLLLSSGTGDQTCEVITKDQFLLGTIK
jgi:hypothetical protein